MMQRRVKNLSIAQNYTFREGIDGLEKMARQATAIKLDMQQAVSFSKSVNTVQGAVQTGAKLQVLGGPFAQFSDPLSMLNESLNDLDSLQDRMVKMFQNLGRFDRETGQVRISGFNRVRINEAASAMGIDPANMMEMINASARRNEIEAQMRSAGVNFSSDKIAEIVKNIGTFENGQAGVNIDGNFIQLSELPRYEKELTNLAKSEGDDIKDIAARLRSWDDIIMGAQGQYENRKGQIFGNFLGNTSSGIANWLGGALNNLLPALLVGGVAGFGGILKRIGTSITGKGGLIGKLGGGTSGGGGALLGGLLGGKKGTAGGGTTVAAPAAAAGVKKANMLQSWWYGTQDKQKIYDANHLVTSKSGKGMQILRPDGTRTHVLGKEKVAELKKIKGGAKSLAPRQGVGVNALAAAGATIAISGGMKLFNDEMVKSGEIARGSAEANKRALANTLQFAGGLAMAGAKFGPWGAAIGAATGALIGGVKLINDNIAKNRKKKLEREGLSLKGDYTASELKRIGDATKGRGFISSAQFEKLPQRIQKKMIERGDYKKMASGGFVEGKSHEEGGVLVNLEGGEMVMNPAAVRENRAALEAMNKGEIKRTSRLGEQGGLTVAPTTSPSSITPEQKLNVEPININISGTIRLEGANGQSEKEILKTGKLLSLRMITREDTDLVVKWRNNPRVRDNFVYREVFTREIHENWLEKKVFTGDVVQMIIMEKNNLRPVGSVYLRYTNEDKTEAEYGIFIGEDDAIGKGYGNETACLTTEYARDELGIKRLILRAFCYNTAAIKSYTKAGFVKYQDLPGVLCSDGQKSDMILMENNL